ncbi:general transcription repressor [Dissophora globulifera]|uniref:General transcription repressor n=1 Tax=Dissophora globulifera TaxID=979702 RepID=A0A9P6RLH3_9FUNG|nr:general transcription repressor [Dissophora globulifera]
MSGIYNHRTMVPGRANGVPMWLDMIKQEFDDLSRDYAVTKSQRDECELRLNLQIQEMESFRRTISELERKHEAMKSQYHLYEEEVVRLRSQVEQREGGLQPHHPHPHSQAPPPNIGQGHSNLFGSIISGVPGGPGLIAPPQMIDPSQQQHPGQLPPQGQHMQQQAHQQHIQQQQQHHPYGSPGGHGKPNMPPTGAPHSPYMGESNGMQAQPQSRRFKTESDGMRYKAEGDIPPPGAPGNMYGNMSPNQHSGSNGQGQMPAGMGPSYNASAPNQLPKSGKSGQFVPNKEEPKSSPSSNKRKPGTAASTSTTMARNGKVARSAIWSDDPDNALPQMKREGPDWFAISNPKAPQLLKVDLVHTMEHSSFVCCVRFSADGKYLATGCNRSAQIFDVYTGQTVCVLSSDVAENDDLYIRYVCFSPDGKYLATGAEDKQIRIWEISRKKIRMILKGHEQDIYSLDFSRDGRILVSGSGDQTARIWDMETGECLYVLTVGDADLKDAGVTSVAISPDGRLVAAGSLDRMVRVWDTHTGQLLERLEGHRDSVYSVAFSPDGKTLISGSLDKTLKAWDLNFNGGGQNGSRGSSCKATFSGHKDFVLSVAVSPDGKWIVSGSKDRGVQFWDPNTTSVQFMLQGHKNSVISVALSPTGTYFATGSGDTRARIWTYESTQE